MWKKRDKNAKLLIYSLLPSLFEYWNKKVLYSIILLCPLILFSNLASAQVMIRGNVLDKNGEPLTGASIVVKGTTVGTITDAAGNYSFSVSDRLAELVFSFIGYDSKEEIVGAREIINVVLVEKKEGLDEIIVVGYGTQKKRYLVGSVSQIGSEELVTAPMTNVSNLMTGKLPGVTSIQRSGQPGVDQTSIAVRGYSTFTNASPLILVDGVERMLNTVNPADIENISILKDAATAAIYGIKGGNGVILVTTKRGSEGKATISYDVSVTFSQNTTFPEFLNGPDYLRWYNKATEMDGLGYAFDADIQTKVIDGDTNGIYGNTDWLGLLFKDFALTQQHNISATGGNEKMKYFVSAGIMDQDGIIENVNYKRNNVRSNIDAAVAENFNLSLNLSGIYENRNWPGIGLGPQVYMNPIEQAIYAIPIIMPTYGGEYTGWTENGTTIHSPIASVKKGGFLKMQRWRFEGNAKLEYDFSRVNCLKGLRAGLFFSYDFSYTANREYLASYEVMAYNKATKAMSLLRATGTTEGGTYNKSSSHGASYVIRPTIEYSRQFGRHNVNAIMLMEEHESEGSTMTGRKSGFLFSDPIDITWGTTYPTEVEPVTGTLSHSASRGYAGRLGYGYDSRYLVELSFRYDGTYIFDKDNRWGFFPSIALGWLISEEKFFEKANMNGVDYLKIRTSYGESGSNDVDPYLWSSSYALTKSPSYVFGGEARNVIYTLNSMISDLTWSRTQSYNVGLDLNMWNGLLGIEFDYFYKVTSDILEEQGGNMPQSLGGNYSSYANSGKVDNRGFELSIKHNNVIKDWKYSLSGNLSWAKNKVLSRQISDGTPLHRNEIGRPMGIVYGLEAIGLYQTQDQLDNSPAAPSGSKNLGDIIYKDFNGDGRIDQSGDFVKIGNGTLPRLNFSLNMKASWKNFYLTALWQGVAKCDYQLSAAYTPSPGVTVMDNTAFTRPFYGDGNAPYYLVEGAWTPENTNAKYPRLSSVSNGNNAWTSSRWLVDGSYLRLKTLQVGYSLSDGLPKKWNTGIGRINFYVAGANLWTLSHFKYVDPEMPGVNNGYYPQQKTYSVGLNVTF